jgi:hypothetical protein
VEHWENKEGVIGLNDGRIVHCQCLKYRGLEALNILRNWISVSFRFFENVENVSIDIEEATQALLASLEAQEKEVKRIRELIPNPQVIFVLSRDSPESRISLDRGLWRVLAMINGRNSVKDICLGLKANEYSVCRVLLYLFGRKMIRMAAAETPLAASLRELFFNEMEEALCQHLGPIGPVVIEDTLAELGKGREYIGKDDLALLIDRIGENLEEEDERFRFQGRMLAVIQRISEEDDKANW